MPLVETTAGPIEADQLGRTLVHEHLLSASESVRYQFPHLYDHEAERARSLDALLAVKDRLDESGARKARGISRRT